MKQCYLAFEIGSMQKTIYPLLGPTTIGRAPENTITLPDPMTSRNHARLVTADGKWVVEDLGSANGIIFGGQRVERVVLRSGDVFEIGEVSFRYIEKEISGKSKQLFETVQILATADDDLNFQIGEEKKKETEKRKEEGEREKQRKEE